jgi:uncharacterized protein (TIGR04255 family)
VCGILFKPLKGLTAPHIGVLWEKFKPAYSRCREVAPLLPAIEKFEDEPIEEVNPFGGTFPTPRTWFETVDGNRLIQVQRDRFLHNWKKEKGDEVYPHYDYVIENFRDSFRTFGDFLKENELGVIEPIQYELTYVNDIPQGDGWTRLGDIGNVFPDFIWRTPGDRFLTEPEVVNWQTAFVLPERVGRLHASIRLGKRRVDRHPVLRFELTARGISSDKSLSGMWSWFDIGHEWIVRGFTDLTSEEMHSKVWRRIR